MTPSHCTVTMSASDLSQQRHEMLRCRAEGVEAQRALCRRWHDRHDGAAGHLLVGQSMGIVLEIAAAYGHGYGARTEDLVGEAYVGLMRALCRFDPNSGADFASYAAYRIQAAVQEFILRDWSRRKTESLASQLRLLARLRRVHERVRALEGRMIDPVSAMPESARPRLLSKRATRKAALPPVVHSRRAAHLSAVSGRLLRASA